MNPIHCLARTVCIPGPVVGLLLVMTAGGYASVAEFQAAAASNPDLIHQYTFDGSSEEARRADQKGTADLSVQLVGTGLVGDLKFAMPGFDLSSESVMTTRGPGTDNANGAYLRAPAVTWGQTVSFEALFQPTEPEISGGQFNLAYVLSTRVGNDRGYFLTQGGPIPSTGMRFASSIGNGHNESNTNTILSSFIVGNWYYVSGSYTIGAGNVTWTNYVADLTAGQTALTQVGPFTNSGGTYPIVSTPLGIGGRWDAQESFPGLIDEVNFYDAALAMDDFQEHLNLLTGAGGLALNVVASGPDILLTWKSSEGKRYNLRSDSGLSNDSATWPILDGNADIEPTEPLNMLTISRPADAMRFFVIEEFTPPPLVVFTDDLESGLGEWTLGNDGVAGTAWELGAPSNVGPLAAKSPTNCFGTNLSGEYTENAEVWLRSPPIDLSTAGGATLSYFEFVDVEGLLFDFGSVSVLDASDDSVLMVIRDPVDRRTTDWNMVTKALPPEALGRSIKIEFRLVTDDFLGSNYPGWYIDDVELTVP
jgi:hypothetical protein